MDNQKSIDKKRRNLTTQLNKVWVWHGGNIERGLEFARVTLREEIKSIETLFNPFPKDNNDRKRTFNTSLNRKKVKEYKKLSSFTHGGNRELKKALKTIDSIHQKQYFRNYQILKTMYEEALVYKKHLAKNTILKSLSKKKQEIGKNFKDYKEVSMKEIKEIIKTIRTARKLINKRAYLDDIHSYIGLFEDFFEFEEFRFRRLINQSMEKIHEKNRDMVVRKIQKENEYSYELPSWNLLLED